MKHSLMLLATAAVLGCKTPTPEHAAGPAPELRIAYNVFTNMPEGNYEIFVMDLDGGNKKNLTNTPGVDWVYAAYDDRILFVSDRDTCHRCYFLYEMDAEGDNVRRISDRQLQDSWIASHAHGAEFLIDPKGINDTAFFRIDGTGSILDTLYHGLAYANDACFSPDGKQVVFRGAHAKYKPDAGYRDELYIINADGSGLRQLTHYPEGDTTAEWWAYHAGPPNWLESGRISYCSKRNGNLSIFSIRPDGTDEQQLTSDGSEEDWHHWSPDERWLVYGGNALVDGNERPQYDIHLMDMRTGNVTALATDTLTEQAPVFVLGPMTPASR